MKLIVVKGSGAGTEFRLHDGINMLGRDVTNRVRLLDTKVSRRHCRIRKLGRSLFLFDLGTKNGTLVNGVSVEEQELRIGDQIKVGSTLLEVADEHHVSGKAYESPAPASFFRSITMAVFGQRRRQGAAAVEGEFGKFFRRTRKSFWRPSVDTDPPEGRRETVISHSDPD
jgi:predicted component of type VI protein secretion system